ncbi:hypothetical protein N0V94_007425 [Neodidymelliopsis sp. IMI 364377]|nr:hypothetical protein N0V94_007425 [Neodidymelliopsis sp. IMI 364377]
MELNFQFSGQPSTVEEEEPSVLEYAREAGICNDYTNELPSLHDLSTSLKNAFDQDPRDPFDDDLANAATAAVQLTRQRLSIARDVALLLKEVLSLRDAAPNGDANGDDDRRRILELKMEMPVLSTDAEIGMLGFGRREELDLRDLRTRLPSEDVDEENDEGFGWPVEYLAYPALYDRKIKGEKLAVTMGDLSFLQGAVRDEYTTEDYKKMIEEDLKARRVGGFES